VHLRPGQVVKHVFGGVRVFARACGFNESIASKWTRNDGDDTHMQQRHMRTILEKARERGLQLTAEDLIFGRDVPDAAPA
jgi:hypothetical protein